MANWVSFVLTIPGKPILQAIGTVLETLLIFLDILEVILDTIKTLLALFGNPLRALVEAIIALVNNLIQSLARTGLYAYYDIPDPTKDPSFKNNFGGYQNWVLRFKGSMLNIHDVQRPQPIAGFLQGGFILMVIDAPNILQMVQLIQLLLKFFGKTFNFPRYLPPANLKALPASSPPGGGIPEPLLSVAQVFESTQPINAISLQWSLPSNTPTADPGMAGLVSNIAAEFTITNWLIERADIPYSQPIVINNPLQDSGTLRDPTLAGPLVINQSSNFVDPRTMKILVRQQPVYDNYNEPVIKFNHAFLLSADTSPLSFIFGQLGSFSYIDTYNITHDVNYYYRVRAYTGPLDVQNNILQWKGPLSFNGTTGRYQLQWPSNAAEIDPNVGKPSKIIQVQLPKLPLSFDVMGNLRALFLTAFSLNFQDALPPGTVYNNGVPTPVTLIGLGSLINEAGAVGGVTYPAGNVFPTANSTNPTMPWQELPPRYQAAKLANKYGSLLLGNGSALLQGFINLMTGSLPAGAIFTQWPLVGGAPTSISELVLSFTQVTLPTPQSTLGSVASALSEINPTGVVPQKTVVAYSSAFVEANVRKNVLAAVNYLKALGHTDPPNWIQMSILRDLIPWSGQILYDILAKIQALLDAFKGIFDEIIAFINLIERKITALEQFIEYLIGIINFLESLYIGCYLLAVPYLDGDVTSWFSAIDTAGGNAPSSGPGGFTCGVCFAYLAPDIGPIATAFSIIF